MKKIKLIAFLVTIIMVISLLILSASAEPLLTEDPDTVCRQVLSDLVEAENTQDWDAYCNLFTKAEIEHKKQYFNSAKDNGVKRVKSAKLAEIQYINSNNSFSEIKDNFRNYIIGVEYAVDKEDKYYINGVNYHYITLTLENKKWKILEYQDAQIENFVSNKKATACNEIRAQEIVKSLPNLNLKNIETMLDIIDARAIGIIINAKGEYLGSNNENITGAEDAMELLEMVKAKAAAE